MLHHESGHIKMTTSNQNRIKDKFQQTHKRPTAATAATTTEKKKKKIKKEERA